MVYMYGCVCVCVGGGGGGAYHFSEALFPTSVGARNHDIFTDLLKMCLQRKTVTDLLIFLSQR